MIIDDAITPRFRQGDRRRPAGGGGPADRARQRRGPARAAPPQQRRAARAASTSSPGHPAVHRRAHRGRRLRAMFGRKLGSLVTGGGFGFLAMLITSSLVIAVIAGIVALLFSLLGAAGPFGGRRGGYKARSSSPAAGVGAAVAGAGAAAAEAVSAPAVVVISAAAAPRETGDDAATATPVPAPVGGRRRHRARRPARAVRAARATRGRERAAPHGRDPHLHRGGPAGQLHLARRRASAPSPCSASCASGTPSRTTAC